MERENNIWVDLERPGYLGKQRDEKYKFWDLPENYGKGNWRIINRASNGEVFNYEDIIYRIYIPGYEQYFKLHPEEASEIADRYSFGYDKDLISLSQAFDIYALYNVPNRVNQFHHVAFNMALLNLGYFFKGSESVQVREGKPGIQDSEQPNGFLWSPGRIECTVSHLIPEPRIKGWWNPNSIEDFYQSTKILQIKK